MVSSLSRWPRPAGMLARAKFGSMPSRPTCNSAPAWPRPPCGCPRPGSGAQGDPYLYPLTVTLTDGQGVTDAYTLDIGIRTVEVRGDQLLLNGEPIKLTGFGRHEDFPLSGRGLNLPMWIRDYELLKWVGANSYRTSHYPYAEEAMQLADRLGILVINEIPAVGLNFEDAEEHTQQRLAQCQKQLRDRAMLESG